MQWFAHRLGNEQAIEWIGVMEGQVRHDQSVLGQHGQFKEVVRLNLLEEFLNQLRLEGSPK